MPPTLPVVSLHPLTAAAAHQIEPWFDHPEVPARLGVHEPALVPLGLLAGLQ
jgi:hypothetical protein